MLANKYYNWYMQIINFALKQNRYKKGHEVHHIIPKCMGGRKTKDNLVKLTLREHYICHLLLPKFTTGTEQEKLKFALWCFANRWGRKLLEVRMTSRMYEKLRTEVAFQISKMNKGRINAPMSPEMIKAHSQRMQGDKNPMYGKFGPDNPRFGEKRPGIGGRKKGTKWTEQERETQLQRRAVSGYYDFLRNPARGKKISKAQRGRIGTALGKIWYNDGIKEYYGDFVPTGYTKGRLLTNSSKIGMKWFNNGIINKQFKEGTQPEGFIHGRINKK